MDGDYAFEATFGPHLDELNRAMAVAIKDALAKFDATPMDEFYIVAVHCDGQYAAVTVGVSNIADHTVNVDCDTGKVVTGP